MASQSQNFFFGVKYSEVFYSMDRFFRNRFFQQCRNEETEASLRKVEVACWNGRGYF